MQTHSTSPEAAPSINAADAPITHRLLRMGAANPRKPEPVRVNCANCKVQALCMPPGLSSQELDAVEDMVVSRIKVKRGAMLFANGDRFKSLYVVRTGFIKTQILAEDGRTRVSGFHMAGDALGLDAVAADIHTCDAIAMEDAEVCVLPFDRVERTARAVAALQHHLLKIMGREIVRQGQLMLMGGMAAEERIASFLLNLSERLHARGYSRTELVLRMSREEIGSAVALKPETVSRTFSKFAADNIVVVKQRNVQILDLVALRELVGAKGQTCAH